MALINCPECGKQISDKAKTCIGCGFPLAEYKTDIDGGHVTNQVEIVPEPEYLPEEKSICPMCGTTVDTFVYLCPKCNIQMKHKKDKAAIAKNKSMKADYEKKLMEYHEATGTYNGIYRIVRGEKKEVYCPKCGSSNCEWKERTVTKEAITSKKVKRNINPLKPLTKYNVKETTLLPERTKTYKYIQCNDCGTSF